MCNDKLVINEAKDELRRELKLDNFEKKINRD